MTDKQFKKIYGTLLTIVAMLDSTLNYNQKRVVSNEMKNIKKELNKDEKDN